MKNKSLAFWGLLPLSLTAIQAEEKPNIVFIFADDMTYDCMGRIGKDEIHTPNLDELRRSGMYFTHAFNQGGWNGAISAASRAMLTTGRYLWKAKKIVSNKKLIKETSCENPSFWPQYMKLEGYTTYMTGKWHVPVSPARVFDYSNNVRGGMPKQSKPGYAYSETNPQGRKFIEGYEDNWQPYKEEYGGYWQGGKHWSEVVRDDALSYIDIAKQKDKPFFMYLAFNAPHDPHQSPKRFVDMYPLDKVSVPESFIPEYPYKDAIGCTSKLRDEQLAPFPRTERSVKVNRQEYYAIISHMDEQIGRIIDALKKSGKYDNTYIIFSADHGIAIGDHGFIGKQNMYDASMRVPLIIAGPGIKKGCCNKLVYLQDAMATALDMAGSPHLKDVDFKSLLPLAKGEKDKEEYCTEDAVYGAYINFQRMIRTDRYKMIIYPEINMVRFYDLKKDPMEKTDLAASGKYKKEMDKMLDILIRKQKATGDPLDITASYRNFCDKNL